MLYNSLNKWKSFLFFFFPKSAFFILINLPFILCLVLSKTSIYYKAGQIYVLLIWSSSSPAWLSIKPSKWISDNLISSNTGRQMQESTEEKWSEALFALLTSLLLVSSWQNQIKNSNLIQMYVVGSLIPSDLSWTQEAKFQFKLRAVEKWQWPDLNVKPYGQYV